MGSVGRARYSKKEQAKQGIVEAKGKEKGSGRKTKEETEREKERYQTK